MRFTTRRVASTADAHEPGRPHWLRDSVSAAIDCPPEIGRRPRFPRSKNSPADRFSAMGRNRRFFKRRECCSGTTRSLHSTLALFRTRRSAILRSFPGRRRMTPEISIARSLFEQIDVLIRRDPAGRGIDRQRLAARGAVCRASRKGRRELAASGAPRGDRDRLFRSRRRAPRRGDRRTPRRGRPGPRTRMPWESHPRSSPTVSATAIRVAARAGGSSPTASTVCSRNDSFVA